MTNDKDIDRYNVGYMGLEEHPRGRFVAHGDHVEIVGKLKAEISSLKSDVVVLNNLNTELEAEVRYWRGMDDG